MLKPRFIAAGAIVVLAAALAVHSAATTNPRTRRIEAHVNQALKDRSRHIDPAELPDVMHDNQMQLVILDVRGEADYNLFHIIGSPWPWVLGSPRPIRICPMAGSWRLFARCIPPSRW